MSNVGMVKAGRSPRKSVLENDFRHSRVCEGWPASRPRARPQQFVHHRPRSTLLAPEISQKAGEKRDVVPQNLRRLVERLARCRRVVGRLQPERGGTDDTSAARITDCSRCGDI
ncbi:MAG: hypothetical protein IPG16_09105 [Comamonadaceae bacterium]|nr:hypothetical protein [Comamonadaceae bacterium]